MSVDGTAVSTILNSRGSMTWGSNAVLIDTIINSGGSLYLNDDTTFSGITVNNGGYLEHWGWGDVTGITVNSGGKIRIGSSASGIVVSSGGSIVQMPGGRASSSFDIELKAGGILMGFSFANDRTLTLSSGTSFYLEPNVGLSPFSSAYPSDVFTSMMIRNGGSISDFTAHSGNVVRMYSSAGAVSNVTLDAATMFVYDGQLSNVTVQGSGGRLVVQGISGGSVNLPGGSVSNAVVHESAIAYLRSGAVVDGIVTGGSNGRIVVSEGAAVKNVEVLELNTGHASFAALENAVAADPELAKKYAELLYAQALLIAGLPMEDPSAYTDLVCELLIK